MTSLPRRERPRGRSTDYNYKQPEKARIEVEKEIRRRRGRAAGNHTAARTCACSTGQAAGATIACAVELNSCVGFRLPLSPAAGMHRRPLARLLEQGHAT